MIRKNTFLEEWSWFNFNNLGMAIGIALKVYTSAPKLLKTKGQNALGANSYVCRSYKGKTGSESLFVHHTILNKVKVKIYVYSSFWNVQPEDYHVWCFKNSHPSCINSIYPDNLFHNLQILVKSFTLLYPNSKKNFQKAGKMALQIMQFNTHVATK